MRRIPSGPCHTAYIPLITARSTCAVQMLLVAFSRRMCCSRVWSAMRSAGRPSASRDTPMMRPGSARLYSSFVAKYAACGPPYPIGTPKRCVLPTAMSAPHSAGEASSVSASRSHAAVRGRVLDQRAEHLRAELERAVVADDDGDPARLRPRPHHVDRLRVAVRGHEEGLLPRPALDPVA